MALRVDEEQTVAVFLISGRKGSCMPRLLLGAAALALVLAGCGGDPESTPSPEVTLTTPVDASASASPAPTLPAAAQADTKAGAIAFVKHYVELINHAQATGNVDPLAEAESKDCRSCNMAKETLREIYGVGGHIEGGAIDAKVVSVAPRPDVNGWTVFVSATFGPQTVVRPSGSQSLKGGRSPMTFVVGHDDNHPVILQWSRGS